MNIFTGVQQKRERERLEVSLGAFEVVIGIRKWKLSAYECGYARLTPNEIERVETSLTAVEAIQRIIAPAKLDGGDGPSLKAAVEHYLAGGYICELQRFATEPPELPAVVTY